MRELITLENFIHSQFNEVVLFLYIIYSFCNLNFKLLKKLYNGKVSTVVLLFEKQKN